MPATTFGFMGNPASLTVGTGSYTVPANKYAFCTAQVMNGGTFTIDASTALSSQALDIARVNINATTTQTHTVNSSRWFVGGAATQASGAAWTYDGMLGTAVTLVNGTTSSVPPIGPGGTIVLTSGGVQKNLIGAEVGKQNTSSDGSFWLPTGTTINTTGTGYYTVQVFNA
jgi:hypothetical protein